MEKIVLFDRDKDKDKLESFLLELLILDDSLSRHNYCYELMENPVSKILFYIKDDKIVSYLDFWITFDSSTIFKIATKEEERRNGYAEKLLEESFKILRENDVLYMTLEVRESNTKAINLYLKKGFKKVTTKPHYYKDGEDAFYLVKGMYD